MNSMPTHPYEAKGVLRNEARKWMIELDSSFNGMESGVPVKVIFWTNLPEGSEPSEYEAIAKRQQLELAVVAQGLGAEGMLEHEQESFIERLNLQGHPSSIEQ